MCGIAGIVFESPGPVKKDVVQSLLQQLEHRGPDDSGVLSLWHSKVLLERVLKTDVMSEAVLVHRRLSILDLSDAGWQPMGTPDGRYYIVFNGEIYNYVELRAELKRLGNDFRSLSDTEVLLAAYVCWGKEALNRLVGMFAFAVLDLQERILFLARDFFGIKPLYYTYCDGGFAFASEIKAILELPGVSRRVHPQRLYDYLRFGITDHAGDTLFLDIQQLPAAHYLKVPLDNPRSAQLVRYWQLDLAERYDLSFDEAAFRLRDLFLDNIRLHLRSDVPVGAALSGGLDSSSIVMTMRYLEPGADIHTFSYVADDPGFSEEHWVDAVGDAAHARVYKVRADPRDLVADLDHLVSLQEEAFGSTSIFAQRQIFRQAREAGIKVMLDGQGADEILGGYHYYISARIGSLVVRGQWLEAIRLLLNASRLPGLGLLSLGLRTADILIPSSLQAPFRALINKEFNPGWMNHKWFDENGVVQRIPTFNSGTSLNGSRRDLLRQSLYDSVVQTSLPHLLRYEDRNSMAFSIESRVPFLTPALVRFVFALPERYIVASNGVTKAVFRRAMRGVVPDAVLDRRDKIGFATPEKKWLLGLQGWVEAVLNSETALQIQALNLRQVRHEWYNIVQGVQPFDHRVWRCLNIIRWVDKFQVTSP